MREASEAQKKLGSERYCVRGCPKTCAVFSNLHSDLDIPVSKDAFLVKATGL